jgi:hypothetical protein
MNAIAAQLIWVTTADGVALATRQICPEVADLTAILLHGLLGDRGSWRCQTSHLTSCHPDIRLIAYDQRGHSRSGRRCAVSNTIGQLARDLDAVIDTTTLRSAPRNQYGDPSPRRRPPWLPSSTRPSCRLWRVSSTRSLTSTGVYLCDRDITPMKYVGLSARAEQAASSDTRKD